MSARRARIMGRIRPAVDGRQGAEVPRARAAEHSHEHGLGAVVGVVTRRDPARAGVAQRLPRAPPTGPPARAPAGCRRARRRPRPPEWHVERAREGLGQVELSRGLRPEPVVDAVGEESEGELPPQEPEHVEERHRVGPAAHGDEDGVTPRDEPMLAHGGPHERDEGGRMGPRQGSSQLERLAELELRRLQRVAPGSRRVVEGAPRRARVEVRTVVAREAELVSRHFEVQARIDERLHEGRRSRALVMSVAAPGRRS